LAASSHIAAESQCSIGDVIEEIDNTSKGMPKNKNS